MERRVTQLRELEVVGVADGSRFGLLGDVTVDLDTGRVRELVIPGRLRLFGLLGREPDRVIPWECVRCFGEDILLVEASGELKRRKNKTKME